MSQNGSTHNTSFINAVIELEVHSDNGLEVELELEICSVVTPPAPTLIDLNNDDGKNIYE